MAEFDLGTARGRIEIDGSGAAGGINQAQKAVAGFGSVSEQAAGTAIRVGAVMGGIGVAAVAGFGIAVNAAANFEERVSAIGAVTNASGEDLDKFRELALKLGQDTKYSAGEAAMAIEELGKAGIPIPDIIGGAAKSVTDLAAAGAVELPRAAEIMANAMNAFGIAGTDSARVADVFSSAANRSAADVHELGMSLAQVSAVAATVGLGFEDTVTALSLFADYGLKGSDAGTSLKTMLLNLQPTTKKQTTLFSELGLMTEDGKNKFFDMNGSLRPLIEIQAELQRATKGMTDQQKLATLEAIGGTDAVRALALITNATKEEVAGYGEALGRQGAASETAKKRMDNLKGSMEQLRGSFETALIRIGEIGQGPIRTVVDFLTKLVNGFTSLPGPVQQIIILIALLGAGAIGAMGAFVMLGGLIVKTIHVARDLQLVVAAVRSFSIVAKAAAAAQWLWNIAMAANPLVLIITLIVAAIAVIVLILAKTGALGKIWEWLKDVGEAVWNAIGKVFNWVKENWDILLAALVPGIGLIILLWRRFGDDIKEIFGKVVGFIKDVFGGIIDFLKNVFNGVVDFIKEIPGRIIDIFKGAGEWLLDAGKNIITGLWNGIKGAAGWIKDQFLGLIKAIIPDPLERFLGISSPSKLAEYYGRMFMEGLQRGFDRNLADIKPLMQIMTPPTPRVEVVAAATGDGRGGPGAMTIDLDMTFDIEANFGPGTTAADVTNEFRTIARDEIGGSLERVLTQILTGAGTRTT